MTAAPETSLVGVRLELEVGPVAHGGHCVARHEGRVVFVRHALPGERVVAVVTEGAETSRFLRADAVEVPAASPDRVEPPCPFAGPGRCGGCDWQHATLDAQRRLKAAVVEEQLRRLAGVEREVVVEALPGSPDGLRWRSRVRYAVDPDGRPGFRRHRSHDVLPVDDCRIAAETVVAAGATARTWPGAAAVEVVVGSAPDQAPSVREVGADGSVRVVEGRTRVEEVAAGRRWQVAAGGFWQVHPAAADTLVAAVRAGVELGGGAPQGAAVLDLYAGVGLFAGALADGRPDLAVTAVEADAAACRSARRNLHDLPGVRIVEAPVQRWLRDERPTADVVVLDPPRAGAGAKVVAGVAATGARTVVYVACDPAALARDLRTFAEQGYALRDLRALDLFPMTHHVECVAVLGR